jgi:hypothetical protein
MLGHGKLREGPMKYRGILTSKEILQSASNSDIPHASAKTVVTWLKSKYPQSTAQKYDFRFASNASYI